MRKGVKIALYAAGTIIGIPILIVAGALIHLSLPYCRTAEVEKILDLSTYEGVKYSEIASVLLENNYFKAEYPDEQRTLFICRRPILPNIGLAINVYHNDEEIYYLRRN